MSTYGMQVRRARRRSHLVLATAVLAVALFLGALLVQTARQGVAQSHAVAACDASGGIWESGRCLNP